MKRAIRIKVRDRWYTVEIEDSTASPIKIRVDGEPMEVEVEGLGASQIVQRAEPAQAVVASPRPAAPPPAPATAPARPQAAPTAAGAQNAVVAPMPGRVLSVSVKEGDSIARGDEVCILEAMKMEQSVRAPRPGVVRRIVVKAGQNVTSGEALVELG